MKRARSRLPDPSALPGDGRLVVATSGGTDSICLLHMLSRQRSSRTLIAVHVDHRMDPGSAGRAREAIGAARELGVECQLLEIQIGPGSEGPESAARKARYAALEAFLEAGDALLTAHHADDQVETVFLRLLRGAGSAALAGMPQERRFGPGWLCRPLLGWRRDELEVYRDRHGLAAVEDPSNLDLELDRNYLRRIVLAHVAERWPGYCRAVLRSAELNRGAGAAVRRQADLDLERLRARVSPEPGMGRVLGLDGWMELSRFRALEALRQWCRTADLAAPPSAPMNAFRDQCENAAADRVPVLETRELILHRWSGRLWLERKPIPPPEWQTGWRPGAPEPLPAGIGQLHLDGRPERLPEAGWTVGSVVAGDRIRLPGRRGRSRVSELMRAAGVPPWQRSRWPCLRLDGRLLAVGELWLEAEFSRLLESAGLKLRWIRTRRAGRTD